jgi:signal transduction histidine kinase
VLIVVCFGLTETLLHGTLLAGLDARKLHLVHLATSVVCAFLVAVSVAWAILRNGPGFLSLDSEEGENTFDRPLHQDERDRLCAQWFITLRWATVLVASLLVFFSLEVAAWLPIEVWWPLVILVGVLGLSNVGYVYLLRCRRGIRTSLVVQAYLDLFILVALLHFSGGIENPCSMLMIFHVMIAGMILSRRQCYWMALGASFMFGSLAWAEWSDTLEHYTLQLFPHVQEASGELFHPAHHSLYVLSRVVLQTLVMLLTAYFVTTLAERLRKNERILQIMADRALSGQQLLEQAMETAGAGLRVLDKELKLLWGNPRWETWGLCPQNQPCPAFEVLNGERAPARETLNDGQVRVTEIVMEPGNCCGCIAASVAKACPRRVLQVTTAPLCDSDGQVQRIVELAQDITVQKQSQAQMIRAGQLAAVGELAGRVAHEVNNPIGIISAKARLLLSTRRAEMSTKISDELGKMTECADRVARIAQGLLSYGRVSPTTKVPLDIRGPIRHSLAMVEQHARNSAVAVQDELCEGVPLVTANAGEMEQLFLNLFLNALDAMPRGGTLKVYFAENPAPLPGGSHCLGVVVEDSGVGIPAPIRQQIFEPFFTTKEEGHGTGLGLSICLGLVRRHDGEIEVDSTEGEGSRFTIKLPVDRIEQQRRTSNA